MQAAALEAGLRWIIIVTVTATLLVFLAAETSMAMLLTNTGDDRACGCAGNGGTRMA